MSGNSDPLDFWKTYKTPSLFVRMIIVVLVFLQFYPTRFLFLPVTLRVIVSALGISLMLLKYISAIMFKKDIYLDKRFLAILGPLAILTLLSAITLNLNGTHDTMYLYYFVTSFLMLSSGYFTINIMHWAYKDKLSFPIIAYYCVLAVIAQLIFGIISYFDKPLVVPLLLKTEEGVMQLNSKDTGRFIGLGQYFMNLGVANGFGLLLIGILLKNIEEFGISKKTRTVLTFFFMLIAVLGNMQARTTTICSLIAFAYLIFSSLKFNFKSLRAGLGQIITTSIALIAILGFVVYYWGDQLSKYSDAIDYGFELFLSVKDGRGANTQSSNMLKWMLTIWPTTDKTWLIGDGWYFTEGGNYYMRTDVGYARLLFYFGVFGMLTFFIYQIIVTRIAFKNIAKNWQSIWFYIYLTILIINVKSCVDYTFYVSLFFSYNILYNKSYFTGNIPLIRDSQVKREPHTLMLNT